MLLFAPADDRHTDVVESVLRKRGALTVRADLSTVAGRVTIDPGRHVMLDDDRLEPGVAIWWRRTGFVPDLPGLDARENQLRREESEALLLGGLLALTDNWVDPPYVVMRAEHSVVQLAVARSLGLDVPRSIATNDPERADDAYADSRRWVAKATSAGVGIAPYADLVDPSMFELLPQCLTLLQAEQPAEADLRIVVVGDRVMTWSRPRGAGDPVDWRAADPGGRGFARSSVNNVERAAADVNARLGLRFSVQDWLLNEDKPVFLEVNPSGQWLFLEGADAEVADALADELTRTDHDHRPA